jgi:hypothetical protein
VRAFEPGNAGQVEGAFTVEELDADSAVIPAISMLLAQ